MATFEQAGIKIVNAADFAALRASIDRLLGDKLIDSFFKRIEKKGLRIRQFEEILDAGIMDQVDDGLAKAGKSAKSLYEALPVTDKGQMREFYLTEIEKVSPEIRKTFYRLYSYY